MSNSLVNYTHEQVIKEWLAEYKSLPKSSLEDYAAKVVEKHRVVVSLKIALNSIENDLLLQLVQPACHQLFEFYRSGYSELKIFVIGLFPAMVGAYLKICTSQKENALQCKLSLGTYLLSIYNLLCGEIQKSSSESLYSESGVEIPNVSHPSAYHDSMAYPFSERTLNMPNPSTFCAKLPMPQIYSCITASNRCKIMYTFMSIYLDYVAIVPKCSLSQVCDMCMELGCIGFPWQLMFLKRERSENEKKIPLETDFSLIILRCVYFALYNGYKTEATKAVQSIQKRSRYEMCPQVLLLCNAILNSVFHERGKLGPDAPLGLTAGATPMMTRSASKVLKLVVTAKSIKHHKWQHTNEEVSGDFTHSLIQDDSIGNELPQAGSVMELEDGGKLEKSISPAKLLKSKMKKTIPLPSAGSPSEKPKILSLTSEKKKKWLPNSKSTEEGQESERSRTPPGGHSVDVTSLKSGRLSSTSVPSLKQLGVEETSSVPLRVVDRSNSLSKNVNAEETKAHEKLSARHSDDGTGIITMITNKKSKSDKNKTKYKTSKDPEAKELIRSSHRSKKDSALQDTNESFPLLDNAKVNHGDHALGVASSVV